jgi:hypothetical protein
MSTLAVLAAIVAVLLIGSGWYRLNKGFKHLVMSPIWLGGALLTVALLSPIWVGDENDSRKVVANPSPTASAIPQGLDADKLAKAFAREFKELGFEPDEVSVGEVDWDKNQSDNRGGAFGDRIESQEELTQFLNGDAAKGRAARQHILGAVPKSERERALDGTNYVPVQYLTDVTYTGNAYVDASGNVQRGGEKVTEAGDVTWVLVARDYDIVWDGSVRADCSNPGYTKPPRPSHHHPPTRHRRPTPTPTPTPCVEIPGNGIYDCGQKDPSKSTLNNPRVDDWKTDGDDRHEVDEDSDGSEDSNGRQDNPREDAEEAEEEAEEETEEREEEHEEESSDDTEVDSEEDHGESEQPDW